MRASICILAILLFATASIHAAEARGTFGVKMQPAKTAEEAESPVGRMQLSKTFTGDLMGSSAGQMLMVRTAVEGSAGYVAMEKVTATLAGKSGSFYFQHNGLMNRGAPFLTIEVVPDSGDGDLKGLSGNMTIEKKDGAHNYLFNYTLPSQG